MKIISKRCGKGSCEFYDKHNKISGCQKFDDRKECDKSLSQRKKVQISSRKENQHHLNSMKFY